MKIIVFLGTKLYNASLLLIRKGANLNFMGRDGKTAAMWSASKGYAEIAVLKALIANGAKLNIVNRDGYSVLDYASNLTEGKNDVFKLCVFLHRVT